MIFQIRRSDGSIDPFSSSTLVRQDGESVHLNREQFELVSLSTWRSPRSGAQYPASWHLEVPTLDLTLEINPYLADQEVGGTYIY